VNVLRRFAWILFVGALAVGTASDRRVISLPRMLDGGWIMRADLHVHSFFGDGSLAPWDLRREAERRGLDAIVITNHNRIGTSMFGAWLAGRSPGPLVIAGQEITAPQYHLIAAGTSQNVDWRQPMAAVIDAVHAQHGVAIAAHPGAPNISTYQHDDILRKIDGIEGPPSNADQPRAVRVRELFNYAARVHPRIAVVGASDYHFLAPIGAYRTYVLARNPTAEGILDGIRAGRTVACDWRGRSFGDDVLLEAVREDCTAMGHGAYRPDRWSRAAVGCAWLALLVLAAVTGPVREPSA
jgi:predicted metal-dependent phosphoesterase TrpH